MPNRVPCGGSWDDRSVSGLASITLSTLQCLKHTESIEVAIANLSRAGSPAS